MIEPKNKQRTIYVERVRHYSINGWVHVANFAEVRGGGIEPKNKHRTIYVERVRHYSING